MDQILQKLIDNTKLECEEAHRKLICSLNGLAGVYILKDDFEQAINTYRQAVSSWKEKEHLKTDSLQVSTIKDGFQNFISKRFSEGTFDLKLFILQNFFF